MGNFFFFLGNWDAEQQRNFCVRFDENTQNTKLSSLTSRIEFGLTSFVSVEMFYERFFTKFSMGFSFFTFLVKFYIFYSIFAFSKYSDGLGLLSMMLQSMIISFFFSRRRTRRDTQCITTHTQLNFLYCIKKMCVCVFYSSSNFFFFLEILFFYKFAAKNDANETKAESQLVKILVFLSSFPQLNCRLGMTNAFPLFRLSENVCVFPLSVVIYTHETTRHEHDSCKW